MICYKNDIIFNSTEKNKVQFSPVYISMVDYRNNPLSQNDPDRVYSLVLKSKNDTRPWKNVKNMTSEIFGFQIPLTKNRLTVVEFSSPDIEVWGKMNEVPKRYDYHFYYSQQKDNQNSETVVKETNIKLEKNDSFLRIFVRSSSPRNSFYFRVNSQGLFHFILFFVSRTK